MIRLTGTIQVPTARRAAIEAALPDHIRLTRDEPGCLRFEVTPESGDSDLFLVYEEFTTQAAFEAHQVRVASSAWGAVSAGLTRDYTIEAVGE